MKKLNNIFWYAGMKDVLLQRIKILIIMIIGIYILGVLFMAFIAIAQFISERKIVLSDLIVALSLVFTSWIGVILYGVARFSDAMEEKYGEIILHKWRKNDNGSENNSRTD